jgi:hypothetical protein
LNLHGRQDLAAQAAAESKIRQAERLAKSLATAKTDVSAWWRIVYWLAAEDTHEALFTHDLTTRSGWALLSEDEQVLPDWSGVYLMTTLAVSTLLG